jgi:hypothetical protein
MYLFPINAICPHPVPPHLIPLNLIIRIIFGMLLDMLYVVLTKGTEFTRTDSRVESLGDGPIPRPEESYRPWYVIFCYLETSRMRRSGSELGCCARWGGGGERERSSFKTALHAVGSGRIASLLSPTLLPDQTKTLRVFVDSGCTWVL